MVSTGRSPGQDWRRGVRAVGQQELFRGPMWMQCPRSINRDKEAACRRVGGRHKREEIWGYIYMYS